MGFAIAHKHGQGSLAMNLFLAKEPTVMGAVNASTTLAYVASYILGHFVSLYRLAH